MKQILLCSLEVPLQGISYEYPQHKVLSRYKKKKKKNHVDTYSYLELCNNMSDYLQ